MACGTLGGDISVISSVLIERLYSACAFCRPGWYFDKGLWL